MCNLIKTEKWGNLYMVFALELKRVTDKWEVALRLSQAGEKRAYRKTGQGVDEWWVFMSFKVFTLAESTGLSGASLSPQSLWAPLCGPKCPDSVSCLTQHYFSLILQISLKKQYFSKFKHVTSYRNTWTWTERRWVLRERSGLFKQISIQFEIFF